MTFNPAAPAYKWTFGSCIGLEAIVTMILTERTLLVLVNFFQKSQKYSF